MFAERLLRERTFTPHLRQCLKIWRWKLNIWKPQAIFSSSVRNHRAGIYSGLECESASSIYPKRVHSLQNWNHSMGLWRGQKPCALFVQNVIVRIGQVQKWMSTHRMLTEWRWVYSITIVLFEMVQPAVDDHTSNCPHNYCSTGWLSALRLSRVNVHRWRHATDLFTFPEIARLG